MKRSGLILLVTGASALSGCAAGDVSSYPSLAIRPVERRLIVAPSIPAALPPAVVSASLAEAIAALGRDADGGETAFRAALADARPLIAAARGAAVGSEQWAEGQRAMSRAETARGPTTLALSELDRLAQDQLAAGGNAAAEALGVQQARVAALASAQQATLMDTLAGLDR